MAKAKQDLSVSQYSNWVFKIEKHLVNIGIEKMQLYIVIRNRLNATSIM